MAPPKKYIIFGNYNFKGWVWLYDCNSKSEAESYVKEFLQGVDWQWTLTKVLKLKNY